MEDKIRITESDANKSKELRFIKNYRDKSRYRGFVIRDTNNRRFEIRKN